MAKLLDIPYPFPKWEDFTNMHDYFDAQDKALEEIPEDRLYSSPVADGQAMYFIVSDNPLVLRHIPFGDAYQLPYAHVRGLRLSDINLHRQMTNLFK